MGETPTIAADQLAAFSSASPSDCMSPPRPATIAQEEEKTETRRSVVTAKRVKTNLIF